MRRVFFIASAFAISSLLPGATRAADASDPTGIWLNDTGRGAIEIKPCGNALCGNVVWVKDTNDAKGCGKQIIGNAAPVGGGRWDNGWIYSPERGRKYNVELKPLTNGTLRVTGYAGMRFLSKTMIWTRAPADLQLCGQPEKQIEAQVDTKPLPDNAKPGANAAAGIAKQSPDSKVAIVTPPPSAPAAASAEKHEAKPSPKAATGEQASPAPESSAREPAKSHADSPAAAGSAKPDASQNEEKTASADDEVGSGLEEKLDGLGLGKVFTRTKSGKCKLDLPWVKLTVDCEQ